MYTYKEAGVDRGKAHRITGQISEQRDQHPHPRVVETPGGFAAGYDLGAFEDPVLLSSCDGVGTKLKLLKEQDRWRTAGWDLVAMNVNDVLTTGATPLQFLDYLGMEELDERHIRRLIGGMLAACEESGCVLAGGELAEMPGLIPPGSVELAGFCTGAAERDRLESTPRVETGQRIYGLPSNGFHANGYSLLRALLREESELFNHDDREYLLRPTRIYAEPVQRLREQDILPSAMVHVTGGGVIDNLERVLPGGLGAELRLPAWTHFTVRKVMDRIPEPEALKTFNMGIGWMITASGSEAPKLEETLPSLIPLGTVVSGDTRVEIDA